MTKKVLAWTLVLTLLTALLCLPAAAAETVYEFDTVTVNSDGSVDGVEGEHLTMTVDGVETAMKPGTYTGNILICATEEYTVIASSGSSGSGEPGGGGPGGGGGGSGEAGGSSGEGSGESEAAEEQSPLASRAILGTELINSGTDADFRTALYVDSDGIDAATSATTAVSGGEYDGEQAEGISITAGSASFGALVVESTPYTLSDALITLNTDSDGTSTNDFTGLGSAISAYGDGTLLTVQDSTVSTVGAAKPALYINGGADVLVSGSTLTAEGGTVYDTYMSNATSGTMLSPPWHLGIDSARGNSRTINLMGAGSTETIVDSTVSAAGWGALSVDNGSYMRMDFINSAASVDEGYTAFAIGQVTEYYYGANLTSGVYDFILMGGNVYVGDYTGGETITVKRMEALGEGKDQYYGRETDEVICEVTSEQVPSGEIVTSSIVSDRFGVEMHSMMNGDVVNGVHLSDGTVFKTGETGFVLKSGFAELSIDGCSVEMGESPYTGDRVLLQIMDNDDAFCSSGGTGAFDEYFWEPEGWSFQFGESGCEDYDLAFGLDAMDYGTASGKSYGQWSCDMDITDTVITGDLWNSTGYWSQGGTQMNVTVGAGAELTGVISSGAYAHPQKTYEVGLYGFYKADGVDLADNTWYNSANRESWENAKYISVVDNTPYYYGANGSAVTVADGGVWNVNGVCFLTGLTVDENSRLSGVDGIYEVKLSVADREGMTDAVTVDACEAVQWDGGEISLAAGDEYTVYVLIPAGAEIGDVITVGESLGYGAEEFEGEYLGSFYVPGEGVQETPLDIYKTASEDMGK